MAFNGFVPLICLAELCLLGAVHYLWERVLKCAKKTSFDVSNYVGGSMFAARLCLLWPMRILFCCSVSRSIGLLADHFQLLQPHR